MKIQNVGIILCLSFFPACVIGVYTTTTPEQRVQMSHDRAVNGAKAKVEEYSKKLARWQDIVRSGGPAPTAQEVAAYNARSNAYFACMGKANNASAADGYASGNAVLPQAPGMFAGQRAQDRYSVTMGCGTAPGGNPDVVAVWRAEIPAIARDLADAKATLASLTATATTTDNLDSTVARIRAQQARK